MPRRKPFRKADLEARVEAARADPGLTDEQLTKLARLAGVPPADMERFSLELEQVVQRLTVSRLAAMQERPAAKIAALQPGLELVERLGRWLEALPPSLRMEVEREQRGAFQGLSEGLERVRRRYVARGERGPNTGVFNAVQLRARVTLDLLSVAHRFELTIADLGPKDLKDPKARPFKRWVGEVLRAAGWAPPDLKKNPSRLTG